MFCKICNDGSVALFNRFEMAPAKNIEVFISEDNKMHAHEPDLYYKVFVCEKGHDIKVDYSPTCEACNQL